MSLFEGMERSEGMIKAVSAAPEKYLIDFFFLQKSLQLSLLTHKLCPSPSLPVFFCFFLAV